MFFFFFQAEDGIRDLTVTGVQTCALPICRSNVTNATRRLSGDHDGTLMVPCPPKNGGVRSRTEPSRVSMSRSLTCLPNGWSSAWFSRYARYTTQRPSGDRPCQKLGALVVTFTGVALPAIGRM